MGQWPCSSTSRAQAVSPSHRALSVLPRCWGEETSKCLKRLKKEGRKAHTAGIATGPSHDPQRPRRVQGPIIETCFWNPSSDSLPLSITPDSCNMLREMFCFPSPFVLKKEASLGGWRENIQSNKSVGNRSGAGLGRRAPR